MSRREDFDKRFKRIGDEIDRDRKRGKKIAWVGVVINLAILLFIAWVIIMVMKHFGVI